MDVPRTVNSPRKKSVRPSAIGELRTKDMSTDAELVGRLVGGDQSALESLYDRHRWLLYSVALRITGDSGTAEELLQDTFFQLWQKASQFDTARGSLIGWLLAMTRHRAIDRIRGNGNRFYAEPFCEENTLFHGPTILTQQIAHELVSVALAGLPKLQREAITLAYFDGLTCEEIATRTRTPLGTVKSRLQIARKKMKHSLSDPRPTASLEPACRGGTLRSVLITKQLSSRICRRRTSQQEANCLLTLMQSAATSPAQLIDCFLEISIDLCRAGTAGLSLLETNTSKKQEFRWTNLAGKLAKCVGGTTPRNFSPCGVTLDRNSPQLFAYPGRYFKYFNKVEFPIIEALVIPFHVGKTAGTVWIVSHDEQTKFDSEDARIMSSLAEFAGCAIHLSKSLMLKNE
jgi:RNA polymerase sigma factor (sigma-70 family)